MAIQSLAQRVLFSIVALMMTATTAIAVPTYVFDGSGTIVVGIDGIDVGGTLWDVEFIDDSVDDYLLATGLSGAQFSGPDAVTMNDALSLALINDLPDLTAFDFNGCTSSTTSQCFITTLFTVESVLGNSAGFGTRVDAANTYPTVFVEINDNSVDNPNLTLTLWTQQTTDVPEPSILALMSVGLIGLVGLTRRRIHG